MAGPVLRLVAVSSILLFVGLQVWGQTCSPSGAAVFKVALEARRNRSGHWLTQVDLEEREHRGRLVESKETGRFTVDVEHIHSLDSCEGHRCMVIRTTITVPPLPPGPDYELFPGLGYYKVNTTGVTWAVARETCVLEGGHLAIINSEEEAELIRSFLARYTFQGVSSNEYAYIGFHDHDAEGQFVTVFGDPLFKAGYQLWHGSEPNRALNNTEDCGLVHRDGRLADVVCHWIQPFICEQEL